MGPLSLTSLLIFSSLGVNHAVSFVTPRHVWKRDGDVAVDNIWADHDKITPLAEQADSDLDGELQLRFSPLIYFSAGCTSYAAVNAEGVAGAGLKPTGKDSGDCRDFGQSGQTYSRLGKSNGRVGIMYSYYLPKVQSKAEQHRHHWLTAVIWLRVTTCPDLATNFSPVGVSYSTSPGAFDTTKLNTLFAAGNSGGGEATHPVVAYEGDQPLVPTEVGPTSALGPPLVGWDSLVEPAKKQLNGIRYEHTKVPFSDANFQAYLDAAYSSSFFTGAPEDGNSCGDDTPSQTEIDPDIEEPEPTASAT